MSIPDFVALYESTHDFAIGIKSTPEALAASYAARTGAPVTPEMITEFAVALGVAGAVADLNAEFLVGRFIAEFDAMFADALAPHASAA